MEKNKLKPCPFCGSEAKFIGDSISIKCPKCGCAFIATNPLLTRMDVAGYWNKREQQTVDAVLVVRCKDCEKWEPAKHTGLPDLGVCSLDTAKLRNACEFCSRGKRRENNGTE